MNYFFSMFVCPRSRRLFTFWIRRILVQIFKWMPFIWWNKAGRKHNVPDAILARERERERESLAEGQVDLLVT